MNITVTPYPATMRDLQAAGVDAEDFATRAMAAHLRACQDAAAMLRVMSGRGPATPAERWALELSEREPAVNMILKGTQK